MPLRPLTRPSQKAGTSLPIGVSAPMPVTTTRRSPSRIGLFSAHALVARDDDQSVASTATSPSTLATALTRPNMPRSFSTVTSRRSVSPGHDHAPEAAVVDAGEEAELAAVLVERQDRDARGLGQRLDHEHARHDRPLREVAGELRLVGGHLP